MFDASLVNWRNSTKSPETTFHPLHFSQALYEFPRAAVAKFPQTEWLNLQKLVVSKFWKVESGIKVLAELVPSAPVGENLLPASLPASAGLLAVVGIPWLIDVIPPSLPSLSHGILLCVCHYAQISPFHTGLGLALLTSPDFDYIFKDPICR